MKTALQVGLKGQSETVVGKELLASEVGSGLVTVYSTAMMIAGMEGTAVASVQDALEDGQTTVGTRVNVAHLAATPCGMKVRFVTELTAVSPNGKGLTFNVAAYDETGLIGEGVHERVVVNKEKFESRTRDKARQAWNPAARGRRSSSRVCLRHCGIAAGTGSGLSRKNRVHCMHNADRRPRLRAGHKRTADHISLGAHDGYAYICGHDGQPAPRLAQQRPAALLRLAPAGRRAHGNRGYFRPALL